MNDVQTKTIEEKPCVQRLNTYDKNLTPEHRAELYETARGFFAIGASTAMWNTGESRMFLEYLGQKADESKIIGGVSKTL